MKFIKETITSRNNQLVKWAASLSEKKCRNAEKAFIIEGEKLTFEALDSELPVSHLFVCESKWEKNAERLKRYEKSEKYENTTVICLSEGVF